MKTFLTIAGILIYLTAAAQTDSVDIVNEDKNLYDPFPNLQYDKVVAYNIGFDTVTNQKKYSGYISIGTFNYERAKKSSRKTMDGASVKKLVGLVRAKSTYGVNYGDCFDPRLGITFLNKDEEAFTILVCFECNFLESTVPIPASRRRYSDTTIRGEESNHPVVVRRYMKGFSKKGRKRLLEFCRDLQMKYCH